MRSAENETTRAAAALSPAQLLGGESLSRALVQGLDTPLAALRATMESLTQELEMKRGAGVPPLRIDGVLREVDRLGKNVRELCDFAAPPVPRPLPCSLVEIVEAARAQLTPEQRARVVVARCEAGAGLEVDGPLLAGCLRRLLENALEATEELVLVVARLEHGEASFSVVDDAPNAFGPGWQPVPFQSTKPNHLGLGLALTQRDIELLDGRLEFLSTPGGGTCVRITIRSKEVSR
jgi:signal transduction histidine kinase